uniref:Uncharacterized protein n=1 Tax=Helianthus annuus TaxID=4232 RepID=A0A251VSC5_HELAN
MKAMVWHQANSPEDESHGLASGVAVSDAPTDTEPLVCCAATKCSNMAREMRQIGIKAIGKCLNGKKQ